MKTRAKTFSNVRQVHNTILRLTFYYKKGAIYYSLCYYSNDIKDNEIKKY